jgi:hypothetical protein
MSRDVVKNETTLCSYWNDDSVIQDARSYEFYTIVLSSSRIEMFFLSTQDRLTFVAQTRMESDHWYSVYQRGFDLLNVWDVIVIPD